MEIEIRIRYIADFREWENIPVAFHTRSLEPDELEKLLNKMWVLAQNEFVSCIQWNEKESLEFHYIEDNTGEFPAYVREINRSN